MAHLQYMPGDPRLVDQLVYELKSKGIFDQFRKECIADVDTRPAYQNLRQRVENSVSTFLSRQTWQPDMNKNQLREKLRKHIMDEQCTPSIYLGSEGFFNNIFHPGLPRDWESKTSESRDVLANIFYIGSDLSIYTISGNYLEQGVERIVDQVVNPKVATVFIPKVEDLVYTVLGITRKKSPPAETSNGKIEDLLPNDLEAVSPGSVKSNDEKNEEMDVEIDTQDNKMEIDEEKSKLDAKEESINFEVDKENTGDIQLPSIEQNVDIDKSNIPLPSEEIKPENIPSPDTSPPKVELEKIELPKEPIISKDIPLPNDTCKEEKDQYFKPVSDDEESSSDSSLRRNMSPLTPIRNFNNENSCDAQQAFENDSADKNDKIEPSSFRFKLDAKSPENTSDAVKSEKKEAENNLACQFDNKVNINNFNTPLYEDSSNSNNLQIDYESDANSKVNTESKVPENDQNSESSKLEKKDDRKSTHKSSHRSRDSHKHTSSKDKRTDSKHSSSRDSSRHDKSKSSKDEKSKSSDKDRSKDKSEKKDSIRDTSRHRSSHKSSHKDSKSHRSSSSSGRHSSKHSDDKKSSSSSSHKDKSSDKNSSEKSKDSKSTSHRSDKDRKSSSSSRSDKSNSKSKDDKEKDKKNKKENDDHYSLSGRGNPNRRSTDRDSNDGSTSSKGSHNPSNSKSSNSKKESKTSSKSESTTTSDSTSPSDKENMVKEHSSKTRETLLHKPVVRIERHLEVAVASPPRLPFVPDVTIKKPKFAANLEEAKRLMKMRKFLAEEQRKMNQEAALLLEFQANVRPSMSQVYSNIPGPELEFACVQSQEVVVQSNEMNALPVECNNVNVVNKEHHNNNNKTVEQEYDNNEEHIQKAHYTNKELLTVLNDIKEEANNFIHSETLIDKERVINSENHQVIENSNIEIPTEENNQNENNAKGLENVCNISNTDKPIEKIRYNTEKDVINESTEVMEQTENTEMVLTNSGSTEEIEKREKQNDTKKLSNVFEVTIITEELSETEGTMNEPKTALFENGTETQKDTKVNNEDKLYYFGEHEKYNAELEKAKFNDFFKEYTKTSNNKLYLINCDSYEENIVREVSKEIGDYEIISYHKNGHLKLPKNNKNVIKNINLSTEISLPDYVNNYDSYNENCYGNQHSNVFSPEKSECSFELSSDYDTKLEEMVNRTSRQEIMEIILGSVIDESPSKMPQIDYLNDSNIDSGYEGLKRKISEISDDAASVNNNRPVLTPNKIRKLSTDQISSTTQENEEIPNNKTQNITRSKYLGKARRVGLPRPKRTPLPNSPSSDKSVENYEQNTPATPHSAVTPNGKIRRSKVPQRYDTSDLYKPKLHYLSRRNQIT